LRASVTQIPPLAWRRLAVGGVAVGPSILAYHWPGGVRRYMVSLGPYDHVEVLKFLRWELGVKRVLIEELANYRGAGRLLVRREAHTVALRELLGRGIAADPADGMGSSLVMVLEPRTRLPAGCSGRAIIDWADAHGWPWVTIRDACMVCFCGLSDAARRAVFEELLGNAVFRLHARLKVGRRCWRHVWSGMLDHGWIVEGERCTLARNRIRFSLRAGVNPGMHPSYGNKPPQKVPKHRICLEGSSETSSFRRWRLIVRLDLISRANGKGK